MQVGPRGVSATRQLTRRPRQIFVRTVAGPLLAFSLPEDAGVADLKRAVLHRDGVSPHNQIFSVGGRVLRDEAALTECGLVDGATVALTFNLYGAGRAARCYLVCLFDLTFLVRPRLQAEPQGQGSSVWREP